MTTRRGKRVSKSTSREKKGGKKRAINDGDNDNDNNNNVLIQWKGGKKCVVNNDNNDNNDNDYKERQKGVKKGITGRNGGKKNGIDNGDDDDNDEDDEEVQKKGSTKRTLCGIVLFKLNTIFSMCFAC